MLVVCRSVALGPADKVERQLDRLALPRRFDPMGAKGGAEIGGSINRVRVGARSGIGGLSQALVRHPEQS